MTDFAADITARARWAQARNNGHPEPAWSTGERLIVALVLGNQATLDSEGYTRQQALQRLSGDLAFYGCTADAEIWITGIRAALRLGTIMTADPYTRCPDCGFTAPPESMDYLLTLDGAGIDWGRPVRVTCMCCHAGYHITEGDVLPSDAEMTCHRCGACAPHPVGAARVRCPGCGLFLLGPDLTSSRRDELRITEGMTGLAARALVQAAKDRRAARHGGTGTGQ
jgi:predicted nucleic acid-binding Zn ribbon protein